MVVSEPCWAVHDLKKTLREKLWAEYAMTAILLDGLLTNKVGEKYKWDKYYKEMPKFAENLSTFRENK